MCRRHIGSLTVGKPRRPPFQTRMSNFFQKDSGISFIGVHGPCYPIQVECNRDLNERSHTVPRMYPITLSRVGVDRGLNEKVTLPESGIFRRLRKQSIESSLLT